MSANKQDLEATAKKFEDFSNQQLEDWIVITGLQDVMQNKLPQDNPDVSAASDLLVLRRKSVA